MSRNAEFNYHNNLMLYCSILQYPCLSASNVNEVDKHSHSKLLRQCLFCHFPQHMYDILSNTLTFIDVFFYF